VPRTSAGRSPATSPASRTTRSLSGDPDDHPPHAAGHLRHDLLDPLALPNPSLLVDGNFPGVLTTNGHLVSLLEVCSRASHLLVTDLDGRLVTDISSLSPGILEQVRLSDNLLTFEGEGTDGSTPYVDDLATGQLIRLGAGSATRLTGAPRAAGRYVLWYDRQGGHVGELAD